VLPVLEGLKAAIGVPVSIDTRKPSVARRALEGGASIINDTLGEETDRNMDEVAAETGAGICVMHSRGTPDTMRALTDYRDVVREVASFLSRRVAELESRGVASNAIAIDPGIGFAKSPAQNLEILDRLDELADLGYPLLVGTSRKSFIGSVLDLPETERLEGTIATVVWAIAKGAKIVRVHDVAQVMRAVRMTTAIMDAGRAR
jgi:dihydropteroate synthase